MALTDQRHTVRFPLPDMIVRGVSHTIYAPVYLDGDLVEPTDPTVAIYDDSNTARVAAGTAATVTNSIAQYTIAAGDLTDYPLGERWRVEWALPLASVTLTPRNDAALVRNGLWPTIGAVDLYQRVPSLDPAQKHAISSRDNHQLFLDEAWSVIQRRLIRLGNRPNLVLEPSALREPHLYLGLALIFEDLSTRLNPAHAEIAARYRDQYEDAWSSLNPRYDTGDDGQEDTHRRPGQPTISLCGGRDSWSGTYRRWR